MKVVRINAIWCPACIVMKKVWKSVEEKHTNIEYLDYDYDFDEDIVSNYQVGKILPVAIFFADDGRELNRLNGEKKIEEIFSIIEGSEL